MRITLLCKRYYTNKDLIEDQFGRLFHIPKQLAKLGHEVNVIALDYRNSKAIERSMDGLTFRTLPSTVWQLPLMPMRAYQAIKKSKPHIFIASGDSHIGYLAWLISKRLACRFVFDVYDYYPAFKGNKLPGMKAMFHKATSQADLVLCASRPLQSRLGQWNSNTLLVENGVDTNLFRPLDKQKARQQLAIDAGIPVIGFFGAITPQRGPLLFAASKILAHKIPNLKILLAGRLQGPSIDLPWIDYRGELSQQEIPNYIAACDLVTLPYANDEFNSMAGPCKIAEYLACQRPVVATRVAGHEAIFEHAPESLCEPNPIEMAAAIEKQLSAGKLIYFSGTLSWIHIAENLNALLLKLKR
ncbi:glycosyltransferase family 4 protein [Magnetovirga frankeli]|uniref:glycosyltransferase family 4 protein n=1 Tax=Magnetovirga frankeli TaxID=947516 RepID=UPI0012939F42|nr:glycosyltransferase family 4 protein [gamma proteobacterium SS-5]